MAKQASEQQSYRAVVQALGRKRQGATAADICAATALPLAAVRELLPQAADEYQGRLRVTESGEILYSFPRGFVSRRRGFWARLRRGCETLSAAAAWLGSFLFKAWIMLMLVGYFVLFMAIALCSLLASAAASSSSGSGSRRRDAHAGAELFNLIFRLWFYSELGRAIDRRYDAARRPKHPPSRPLHRAIFAFVFGDGDPNRDWAARESSAAIAYVQANQGAISLPEFMALTGQDSGQAAESLMAFCAKYSGSPEATEQGTIVYRFDALMLAAESAAPARTRDSQPPPMRRLKAFSENTRKTNGWLCAINAVNLLGGGYFLRSAIHAGTMPLVGVWLGLVPLAFSLLFWLIPCLRFFREKSGNEETKVSNFRRLGFGSIWAAPQGVSPSRLSPSAAECRPTRMAQAQERVVKDMGGYSPPEVEVSAAGETLYTFAELALEKAALEAYRAAIAPAGIGKTVFDSE